MEERAEAAAADAGAQNFVEKQQQTSTETDSRTINNGVNFICICELLKMKCLPPPRWMNKDRYRDKSMERVSNVNFDSTTCYPNIFNSIKHCII